MHWVLLVDGWLGPSLHAPFVVFSCVHACILRVSCCPLHCYPFFNQSLPLRLLVTSHFLPKRLFATTIQCSYSTCLDGDLPKQWRRMNSRQLPLLTSGIQRVLPAACLPREAFMHACMHTTNIYTYGCCEAQLSINLPARNQFYESLIQ